MKIGSIHYFNLGEKKDRPDNKLTPESERLAFLGVGLALVGILAPVFVVHRSL